MQTHINLGAARLSHLATDRRTDGVTKVFSRRGPTWFVLHLLKLMVEGESQVTMFVQQRWTSCMLANPQEWNLDRGTFHDLMTK